MIIDVGRRAATQGGRSTGSVVIDSAELAGLLFTAMQTRTATTPFAEDVGLSVDDAAAVQDAFPEQLGAKLGLTSVAKQRHMSVDEPLHGRLTTAMFGPQSEPPLSSIRVMVHEMEGHQYTVGGKPMRQVRQARVAAEEAT